MSWSHNLDVILLLPTVLTNKFQHTYLFYLSYEAITYSSDSMISEPTYDLLLVGLMAVASYKGEIFRKSLTYLKSCLTRCSNC